MMFTNDDALSVLVTGLKNAHAMENQALSIMKPQVQRIENYPDMRARLEQHIGETEGQIERLETIFGDLQERHSTLKDTMLSVGGSMAVLGHAMAGDEVLKDTFANHAFENYEIAAYRSLITLSEMTSLANVTPLLEQNLSEEENMAQWIRDHIKAVTERYVSLSSSGQTAKR
ncbi:ferritin-like domain-containing protein [Pelagibacterium sp. 26DY04]|uniref:ferritin-like domain-containing protein n=1 Tax=Pelagibacterium sp. 26DY04 TaxID=2967130 RepID=UPI002814AA26|nr:ferritin-like domain-containing protein [Pelagibacterium sp. 26DY04]